MPTRIFRDVTQEEHNFALGFGLAIANEDELLASVAKMNLDGSERLKTNLKKMMVVYKVLKKLWDGYDDDGFVKLLRLFLQTHRCELVSICVASTLWVGLSASMENAETTEQPEQHYLITARHLKFIYDLRKEAGIPTDV